MTPSTRGPERPTLIVAAPHKRYDAFEQIIREGLPHIDVRRVTSPLDLEAATRDGGAVRYIFFPHWSWRIHADIFERFECVIFHMTDVPFGRGGSPLQNLIARGFRETMLSAIRCVEEMDAGPVYAKRPLTLEGTAEEIYARAARLAADLALAIVRESLVPVPQQGPVVTFARRKPEEGNLETVVSLSEAFDHIRMLDAEGYPAAFLRTPHLRLEFSDARFEQQRVIATVTIRALPTEGTQASYET